MLKRARVYICDHCGAIALEQTNFFVHDTWKSAPEGWTKLGNEDLCPLCAAIYRKFKGETEMGVILNLITDMTLKGATEPELARAVKHSMVVIDAEKHGLDYKQSEKDNGIAALKAKYQGTIKEKNEHAEN